MSEKYHLSFSIGPVQGFVAQARRTRDLWAGSWLLSCLVEHALVAAEEKDGKAILPDRSNAKKKLTSLGSPIGGMPNRFELSYSSEKLARAGAEVAKEAFTKAWKKVADAVWERFVEHVAENGHGTKDIWARQVESFWELNWVVATPGEEKTLNRIAAARKAFRNVTAGEEGGIKCSLMGNMQELSGKFNANEAKVFWDALKGQSGVSNLDFRDGERLCAIALIKRLYPKIIKEIFPEADGSLQDQEGWPSTALFAAHQWLCHVSKEDGEQYKQKALATNKIKEGERGKPINPAIDWATIDAQAWYRSAFHGKNDWKLEAVSCGELRRELKNIYDKYDKKEPLPVYALLVMDGDSMGALLQELGDPGALSECLGNFARKVDEIVSKHHGKTIYAGGDDVLAILPPEKALAAAHDLAREYTAAFAEELKKRGKEPDKIATLSGALLFAHWKYPLRQVMRMGHHLLDDVAKDQTGRNALAVGLLLGSGLNALWSAPWPVIRGEEKGSAKLSELIDRFGTDHTDQESATFNASFLYKMREHIGALLGDFVESPGAFGRFAHTGEDDIGLAIVHAEYRRRLGKDARAKKTAEDTEPDIKDLMSLSKRWYRDTVGQCHEDKSSFGFDGWRVGRALKEIKENRMVGHD